MISDTGDSPGISDMLWPFQQLQYDKANCLKAIIMIYGVFLLNIDRCKYDSSYLLPTRSFIPEAQKLSVLQNPLNS